ncbi:hypothetical protein ACFY9R_28965 [Streptomyces albidoflavus]|uniref:hypothetical protein n=1 Tax=Streptomyces albidoflavus TaxID=1886 RepID=UPI0033C9EA0D
MTHNSNDDERPLGVGDALHGFCGGLFGRDHYDCCRVEAIGQDWVVTRADNGTVDFLSGRTQLANLRDYRKQSDYCPSNPCTVRSEA